MNFSNSAALLAVRGVGKTYETGKKEIRALSNVSLEAKEGEVVSIIGQNASGKSTLLKILAGVGMPTSGVFELRGDASYMPQDHALLPWRTVEGNLLLPADIAGASRGRAQEKARALLSAFGLEQYARLYPAALSGGTKQKAALLRTVLHDHSLLLLDEPFAPLDALTRIEAQTWLLALLEKTEASVLLVTHDIREAIFLSDTIYVLGSGRIKEKFDVPIPRPRRHEQLRAPEALELEKRLFSLLAPV